MFEKKKDFRTLSRFGRLQYVLSLTNVHVNGLQLLQFNHDLSGCVNTKSRKLFPPSHGGYRSPLRVFTVMKRNLKILTASRKMLHV